MTKKLKMKTKIIIETPFEEDTHHFQNLLGSLGEMNRDNFFQYRIKICKKCEECGAINDTVTPVDTPLTHKKIMLCDHCA